MTDKDEVKSLWRRCFHDSDAFIDMYFRLRYTNEISRVVRREGKIVSALQAIPYPMTWNGAIIPIAYISGACTHPDYRKQGLMRQLLKDTHRHMHADGILLSTLIPAEDRLRNYYARSGYVPVFREEEEQVPVLEEPTAPQCRITACQAPDEAVYRYFDTRMRERPCCILHTEVDFHIIWADWQLADGKLWIARQGENVRGMAFAVKDCGTLRIKELLTDNPAWRRALLNFAGKEAGVSVVSCPVFPPKKGMYRGMARMIHAEKLLGIWAKNHPDATRHIRLKGDDVLPENNGFYTIRKGLCLRTPQPGIPCHTYTVASLTFALLENECPYLSLMLD